MPEQPDLVEFMRRYFDAYNRSDVEAVLSMVGDTQVRHIAGETAVLDAAASRARVEHWFQVYRTMHFEPVVVVADDPLVSATWNAVATPHSGEGVVVSSIEVFRIEHGRIVEVWNAKESYAHFLP